MSTTVEMICPDHGTQLVRKQTKHGGRWCCPESGCTVRCWEGSTSTPCDQDTAECRKHTHECFDELWQNKRGPFMDKANNGRNERRNRAYKWLAKVMDLPREKAHIGMFDMHQCVQVLDAIRDWNKQGRPQLT